MFTRRQAAIREEQMEDFDLNPNTFPKEVGNFSEESQEEILTEYEDDNFTCNTDSDGEVVVQAPSQGNKSSNAGPRISKNKRNKTYSKRKSKEDLTHSPDMNPHNEGSTPDNQSKYMLEKFAQMINGALGKMTETIGNIFKTTVSEFTHVKQNTGDCTTSKKQSKSTTRASNVHDSESSDESDANESSSSQASSVATNKMFSKRNNVSIKLPAFKGEVDESWKAYINRFEAVASYNGWGDSDKLGQLLPRLQGAAGEFAFEELNPEILSSYRKLRSELGHRFGVYESPKTFQTKFKRRDQRNGESAQAYGAALQSLYRKAYPNRDDTTRQEDLVSRFLLGLMNEKARVHLELNKDPWTIEEAIRYVNEFEETTRYPRADNDENDRYNKRRQTRQVKSNSTDNGVPKAEDKNGKGWTKSQNQQKDTKQKSKHSSSEQSKKENQRNSDFITRSELKDLLNEVLSKSSASTEQPQRQRNPLICYRCGEQGHYAKNCSSENVLASYKDRKLNPQVTEFKPQSN